MPFYRFRYRHSIAAASQRTAERVGAVPAAVTFDKHPEDVILGRPHIPLITAPADRAELIAARAARSRWPGAEPKPCRAAP